MCRHESLRLLLCNIADTVTELSSSFGILLNPISSTPMKSRIYDGSYRGSRGPERRREEWEKCVATEFRVSLASIHIPLTPAPHSSSYILSPARRHQFQVFACYIPHSIVRYMAEVPRKASRCPPGPTSENRP
jgi:hypothetical protein